MNMKLFPNIDEKNIFNPIYNPNNINNFFYTCINIPSSIGGNKINSPIINNNFHYFNSFLNPNYFNSNYPIFENNNNINKIGVQNDININKNNNLTPNINSLLNTNYKSPFTPNGYLIKNYNINDFRYFENKNVDKNLNFNDLQKQKSLQIPLKIKSNINKNKIIINDSEEITSNSECILSTVNNSSKKEIFKFNKNEISNSNTNVFNITLKKKRGRMSLNANNKKKQKRTHNASDYDNILRKIQVHFLTFVVNFINEILSNINPENKELRFQNLSYDIKKNVKHSYVEELKNSKLGEILPQKASSKFKKYNLNTIIE